VRKGLQSSPAQIPQHVLQLLSFTTTSVVMQLQHAVQQHCQWCNRWWSERSSSGWPDVGRRDVWLLQSARLNVVPLLTQWLTDLITYLHAYLITDSLTQLLTNLTACLILTHKITYLNTYLFTYLNSYLLTHLNTYLLTHILTYLLTYLLTYILKHILT